MSIRRTSCKITLIGIAALAVLSGCYVTGGGYGYDDGVGVGYVGGYYAPGGYEYGGWGRGYRGVSPPRGGGGYGHGGRSPPSIPGRGRGR